MRRKLAIALACGALIGCAGVRKAGQAYDELWAPIEGVPPKARALQTLPLDRVLGSLAGWDLYELGRRFEAGLAGAPKDLACASVFYRAASRAPYLDEDELKGFPITTPRVGVPLARAKLKRLPPMDEEVLQSATSRCYDLVSARFRRAP